MADVKQRLIDRVNRLVDALDKYAPDDVGPVLGSFLVIHYLDDEAFDIFLKGKPEEDSLTDDEAELIGESLVDAIASAEADGVKTQPDN